MKCQHCGKNDATFYYKQNINGEVSEQHLCADCARELGCDDMMNRSFAEFDAMRDRFFGGFDSFFAPMLAPVGGQYLDPFSEFEQMLTGGRNLLPSASDTKPVSRKSEDDGLLTVQDRSAIDTQRRVNALRSELQQAVEAENFERAAVLRDEIHQLEKKD